MIIDTNALSAAADGEPDVAREFAKAACIAVPVIVLGEYRFGIRKSYRRREYEQWLSSFFPDATVLDVDAQTAEHYAEIRSELKEVGTPVPSNDLWIAALCRQHHLPILSRDRHFDRVHGLKRHSW